MKDASPQTFSHLPVYVDMDHLPNPNNSNHADELNFLFQRIKQLEQRVKKQRLINIAIILVVSAALLMGFIAAETKCLHVRDTAAADSADTSHKTASPKYEGTKQSPVKAH